MSVIAKCAIPTIILLLVVGAARAQAPDTVTTNKFSDPDDVARVGDDFLSREVQYGKKVGDVDVVISLGQQTYPALHKIVEKIARVQGIKIDLQQGSCGATAKKLLNKSVDIGTYCCPPGKGDRLPGLEFHTIAIAPIALTTNTANSISDVSLYDARNIFNGESVTWSDVPGSQDLSEQLLGKKIQPVVRLHCKKRPGHWHLLLDNQDDFSPRAQSVGTISDMLAQVSDNKSSIGYETTFMLRPYTDKGQLKILSIDGNHPQQLDKLLNAEYPLYRTYNLTTWRGETNNNDKARKLLTALIQYIDEEGERYDFIAASKLRSAGWGFKNDELISEPGGTALIGERN